MRIRRLLTSAAFIMLLAVPAYAAPQLIQANRYEGYLLRNGSAAERTDLVLKYDAVTGAPVSYLETVYTGAAGETKRNGTFTVKEDRAAGASRFTLKAKTRGHDEYFLRTSMGTSLRARNTGDGGTLLATGAQLLKDGKEIMRFPASYSGTIPAASGPGILMEVTFRADHTFRIAETYIGEPEGSNKFYGSGRWSVSMVNKKPLLTLKTGDGDRYFTVGDKSVTMVDSRGHAAESKLNYTLTKAAGGDLFKAAALMEGEYSQTEERVVFRDTATGRSYLVAKGGDNADMERAYSDTGTTPGKYLPAMVKGSLVIQHGADGHPEEMLLVERLVALGSQEIELVKGDWKIVSAGHISSPV